MGPNSNRKTETPPIEECNHSNSRAAINADYDLPMVYIHVDAKRKYLSVV